MLLSLLFPTDSHFLRVLNASLNADVEGVDTLLKEYVINVGEDQRLDLSFIPSNGNSNNYAFINGIEVVSMPNDLYYTPPEDNVVFKLLF
ncbi:receptor protein kinase FERONIA [Trifolium repens]|nr:receptor protein kinase FERONIA [Trifolium repens]